LSSLSWSHRTGIATNAVRELQISEYQDDNAFRVVDIDGEPWFVLAEEVKPKAWTARLMEKHRPICQKKEGANGP